MRKLLFFTLASLLVVAACKKEQPCMDASNPACENYDPCHDYTPLKADFRMGQVVANDSPLKYTEWRDTLMWWGDITFEALGQYDSVKWIIGSDPRVWRDKKFSLGFQPMAGDPGEPDSTRRVPVTLIGWRKPRQDCDPSTKSSDTLTRLLVLTESYKYKYVSLVGAYHVKFDNGDEKTGDTLTFYINTLYCPFWPGPYPDGLIIENLPRGIWAKDFPNYGNPNTPTTVTLCYDEFEYNGALMGEFPFLHSLYFNSTHGLYYYAYNNGAPRGYVALAPNGKEVTGAMLYYKKLYTFSGTKIK